jgi:copper chaperone NosL
MKPIEPDAIPELAYMPWIVSVLSGLGLGAAAIGRRWALYTWFGALVLFAAAGLVDFWLWAYDYGHNLDEANAIIKVPGMSYQPPLIGSKKLLNFVAHSWPGIGGWIAFVCAGLASAAVVRELTLSRARHALLLPTLLVASCSAAPQAIALGDACTRCHMPVADVRWGAERITSTGVVHKYDSIECLARDLLDGADAASLWVVPFDAPGTLLPADEARFLRSADLRCPMGQGITAFGPDQNIGAIVRADGDQILTWAEVLELVRTEAPSLVAHTHVVANPS